nr:hypothetical protein [Thiocapsa sp. KS1]
MLDELAAYATRVEAARAGGGSSVATFLMSLFQYAKEHIGLSVIITLASQKDAFARQTSILTDLVSKAKGEQTSAADRAYGEVRKVSARDETTVTPMRGQEISRVVSSRTSTGRAPPRRPMPTWTCTGAPPCCCPSRPARSPTGSV